MDEKFKRLFDSLPDFIKQGHQEAIKELMELAPKKRFIVRERSSLFITEQFFEPMKYSL